ncbi:MAG: hypothetical protein ACI4V7_10100 [Succinivibrionaceae bacterium]
MVATIKKTKQTKRKTISNNKMKTKESFKIFLASSVIVMLLAIFFSIVYLNNHKSTKNLKYNPKTKSSITNKKEVQTYDYTQLLENKVVDSGSGVENTRNYEAETRKKEALYRKQQQEKKKKIEEKLRKEKELLKKKNETIKSQNSTEKTRSKTSYTYVKCGSFRTLKEAEEAKAKIAFLGVESTPILIKIGGGYAYSLNVGNCISTEQCTKIKQNMKQKKVANSCAIVNT